MVVVTDMIFTTCVCFIRHAMYKHVLVCECQAQKHIDRERKLMQMQTKSSMGGWKRHKNIVRACMCFFFFAMFCSSDVSLLAFVVGSYR